MVNGITAFPIGEGTTCGLTTRPMTDGPVYRVVASSRRKKAHRSGPVCGGRLNENAVMISPLSHTPRVHRRGNPARRPYAQPSNRHA